MRQVAFGAVATGTTSVSLTTLEISDLSVSPLYERLAHRESLVEELLSRLQKNGLIALHGSTSVGKSTLAVLLATGLSGSKWRRLDLRGLEPEPIRDRLIFAAASVEDTTDFLLDDINFDDSPHVYENALAALIYVVRNRGGRIIITTQGQLPSRIRLLFDLPEECSYDVPLLAEEEILDLAQRYDCPAGSDVISWSKLIFANTAGHPLLAHAQVKSLQTAGWPKPTAKDLSAPQAVNDIRREIRRRLQDLLPSDAARMLAYRLSVFIGLFRKSDALYLGEHPSPLSNPGEAFELLVGPWLERVSDQYYRLSPLLTGSADEMLPGGANELHPHAAMSYLAHRAWTQLELWGVLFHGILGESIPALFAAIRASLQIEDEHWPALSRQLRFFCFLKTLPNEKLLNSDRFLSLVLRWLQFRIAAAVNSGDFAPVIVERWAEEVAEFDGKDAYAGSDVVARFMFANLTLINVDVELSLTRVVKNLAMAHRSLREGVERQHDNPLLTQIFGKFNETWGDSSIYFEVAVNRCKTATALLEFISALENLPSEEADEIWAKFAQDKDLAMRLVDSAWLSESKLDSPNWDQCLSTFDHVARLSLEYGADSLFAAASRAKAIVFREYLQDSAKAHEALDKAGSILKPQHPIIQDYRAKIFSLDGDFTKAISVWNSIEPVLQRDKNTSRIFTYRDAEIAAAGLNDWTAAAKFALKAEEAARSASFKESLAIGFHAEHAFALWMSGDRSRSISAFVDTLDMIGGIGDVPDDLDAYLLRRKLSHTIVWMKQDFEGGDKIAKPPVGWFSDQASTIDRNEDLDPNENVWYHLAKLEYACMAGNTAFARFEQTVSKTPLQQGALAILGLGHTLRNQPVQAALVAEFADFSSKLREAGESFEQVARDWESYAEVVQPFLLASLVVACCQGNTPTPLVIDQWGDDAQRLKLSGLALENWLDTLRRWLQSDESELDMAMKDGAEKTEIRILASLLLTAHEDTNPENLFYASVALLTTPNIFGVWSRDIEPFLSKLVSKAWLRATKNQRFALRSPNLTVPLINNACESDTEGFSKAAKIVVAARNAVQTRLPDSLLTRLIELSGGREDAASATATGK